jgi:hypothetical protein
VLLLGIACYLLASRVVHGPVNGRSLYFSVSTVARGRGAYSLDAGRRCKPTRGAREWLCAVDERGGGSGQGVYRVQAHKDDSCWEGVASSLGQELPREVSGCVHLLEGWF